jgi:hypothetical protein
VPVLSGELGSAGMINELPALEGQKYYEIYFRPITTTYTPYGTFTQELGDFSGGLSGFWNLANGYHVLQAYTWGENEMYIYLDAQRIDATLAGLIGTTPMSINAIFMDIHLSKVLEFN